MSSLKYLSALILSRPIESAAAVTTVSQAAEEVLDPFTNGIEALYRTSHLERTDAE
jgi:hypothetical protein